MTNYGKNAFMNTAETAELCRCSESHVRAMCQRGELPAVRFGGRWLVKRRELESMLGISEVLENDADD